MSRGAEDAAHAAPASVEPAAAPQKPYFEVTRGNPTATEVGILAAVFATAAGNGLYASEHRTGVRDDWGTYEDRLRAPFGYNPNSFRNRRQY